MNESYRNLAGFLGRLPQWSRLILVRLFSLKPKIQGEEYFATSMDLCDHPNLAILLGARPIFFSRLFSGNPTKIIGWGRKQSGNRAVAISEKYRSELILVEDGFLRSVNRMDEALSFALDRLGIYYDADNKSQIEGYICEPLTQKEVSRATNIMRLWKDLRVSKYNSEPEYLVKLPKRYVLVVDQVYGDLSVGYGNADASVFDAMLQCALVENPDSTIMVKVHPDMLTKVKKGYFDLEKLKETERVKLVSQNCHPVRLIEHAEVVYTVTSQVGFEALIWGKRVRCFGMPFYAGWGLTEDELPKPDRREPVEIEQLVIGALVKYTKYVDPELRRACDIETVLSHIGLQRTQLHSFPSKVFAFGFSRWKERFLRNFLFGSNLQFVKSVSNIPPEATVAIWGNEVPIGLSKQVRILRIEDGFLRSSGLGADLIRPLSWVIDDEGIYYDSSRPSKLEKILQYQTFDDSLLIRAEKLKDKIVSSEVSKYNLIGKKWTRPHGRKRVILVPGQVENDASILYGSPKFRTNIDLLISVRTTNPEAYIVYKPHPDVVAGLRRKGSGEDAAQNYCDEVVADCHLASILDAVDEVHTMTSLTGFEALLRGVQVTCYGQPFYSGWGLTIDKTPNSRRTRRLEIEELLAGALILYPRYISRVSNRFTTVETCINELVSWRERGPSRMPVWRRILRLALRLWAKSGMKRRA